MKFIIYPFNHSLFFIFNFFTWKPKIITPPLPHKFLNASPRIKIKQVWNRPGSNPGKTNTGNKAHIMSAAFLLYIRRIFAQTGYPEYEFCHHEIHVHTDCPEFLARSADKNKDRGKTSCLENLQSGWWISVTSLFVRLQISIFLYYKR